MNAYRDILVSKQEHNELFPKTVQNVTEDFLRCVVWKCTEQIEFEIDGMKFRATCERIE